MIYLIYGKRLCLTGTAFHVTLTQANRAQLPGSPLNLLSVRAILVYTLLPGLSTQTLARPAFDLRRRVLLSNCRSAIA